MTALAGLSRIVLQAIALAFLVTSAALHAQLRSGSTTALSASDESLLCEKFAGRAIVRRVQDGAQMAFNCDQVKKLAASTLPHFSEAQLRQTSDAVTTMRQQRLRMNDAVRSLPAPPPGLTWSLRNDSVVGRHFLLELTPPPGIDISWSIRVLADKMDLPFAVQFRFEFPPRLGGTEYNDAMRELAMTAMMMHAKPSLPSGWNIGVYGAALILDWEPSR